MVELHKVSNVFSGLAAGSYNINGVRCKRMFCFCCISIVIANPALLTASAVGSAQVSCHNSADGIITVTALGGTGAYSYSLNGGTAQSSNVFSGLVSGSYSIIVTDAKGCSTLVSPPVCNCKSCFTHSLRCRVITGFHVTILLMVLLQ